MNIFSIYGDKTIFWFGPQGLDIQSTPLNRVTLVPEHFDPIKRNLGVGPIKRSELILFLWFCSWPSDPINRWPKLNR